MDYSLTTPGRLMPDEKVRGYIYRITVAVGVLVGFYGYATQEEIALWLGLVSAVLGILPAMNTSIK